MLNPDALESQLSVTILRFTFLPFSNPKHLELGARTIDRTGFLGCRLKILFQGTKASVTSQARF